jgi:hypothetical protein
MARTTFSGPVASENGFLNLSTTEFGVTITAPAALAADYTLTLPPDDGTAGQAMITDGAGTLTWSTVPGSGTVTSVTCAGTVNGLTLTSAPDPITTSGTITLGGTLVLSSPPAIGAVAPAAGAFTSLTGTLTAVSATPGTSRAITGKYTTFTTMTTGNLVGVRGEVTAGGTISAPSSLYGAQGKIITGANTVNGTIAAVFAQFDMTGGTIGTGNQAAIAANFVGVASGTVALNGLYVENAGGGAIHSYVRGYGNATYVFDIESTGYTNTSLTGTAGTTAAKGWLKVLVEGVVRYIPLTDAVT